ncbi:hypothetical protein EDB81DRAFT_855407 [Dactylonectria macrodidyma]|uniref:Apple domain-containing protein n=1 Tax=Dactylonectria macrodidyma TaxID=307937 RepID=A0A9P9F4N3_9HYPO|nr:hypothetical protein EDB81DRAFT_855407 [Dactylonectria macrodidyma]
MALIKLIAAVVAFSLAGVEAGGAPLCTEIFPRPRAYICNTEGYIKHDSGKLNEPVFKASAESCADHCAETDKCTSFLFREGLCQLYKGSFSKFGFTEHESYSYWYEMECFRCSDAGVVIGVDFEGDNHGSWTLYGNTREAFSFEVKEKGFDGSAKALRVKELTNDGNGRIQWANKIPLKTGVTYALGFAMKNNKKSPDSSWAALAAELLTLNISKDKKKILHTHPEHSMALADGWTQYHSTFKVPADLEGDARFSISIESSGSKIEWYFDDIYIKNISE